MNPSDLKDGSAHQHDVHLVLLMRLLKVLVPAGRGQGDGKSRNAEELAAGVASGRGEELVEVSHQRPFVTLLLGRHRTTLTRHLRDSQPVTTMRTARTETMFQA